MTMDDAVVNRQHENGGVPIRSDRLFTRDNYWYFRTREGLNIGPFDSAAEASEGIKGFIDFLKTTEPAVVRRIRQYATRAA